MVVRQHSTPRSYVIQTSNGTLLRRNRKHLKKTAEPKPKPAIPLEDDENEEVPVVSQQLPDVSSNNDKGGGAVSQSATLERHSRCERVIRPPKQYRDD